MYKNSIQVLKKHLTHILRHELWHKRSKAGKFFILLLLTIVICISSMYAIARWYQYETRNEKLVIGATFISDYAEELGVEPRETLQATINDLGIKDFRLVSYWKNHEPVEDQYDFTELDWQFDMIEEAGGTVSLAIGLRQPRWPECHGPEWAMQKDTQEWTEDLLEYTEVTINRYKDREILKSYQLENEFLLQAFGDCPDHDRERLKREYDFVKNLDPNRPVIVSRSNNAVPTWPAREPIGDETASSIYKRVWDQTITKRYFEYPFPAWYYSYFGGISRLTNGQGYSIHELQTEAWTPSGMSTESAPIDELYKSLSPERLKSRLDFAVDTGVKRIDVWGVEWWYQMKTERNAPELWETAKVELNKYR